MHSRACQAHSKNVVLVNALRQLITPKHTAPKFIGITAFSEHKIIDLEFVTGYLVLARLNLFNFPDYAASSAVFGQVQ